MADGWSKKQRRELRILQGLVWERELAEALRSLSQDFDAWERGDCSVFDLSDRIDEFHTGPREELFNRYTGNLWADWIARAIVTGVLDETELSAELRDALKDDIAYCRRRFDEGDRAEDAG
jgi:hypothetical protein